MYKELITLIVNIVFIMVPSLAVGDGVTLAGTIKEINVNTALGSSVQLKVSTVANKASCSTSAFQFSFDAASVIGSAMLAVAMTAQSTGKLVDIYGNNLCTHYSHAEDVRILVIK